MDTSILPSLHKNRQRHLAKIAKRRNRVMTQHRDFRVLTACRLGGLHRLFGPQSKHSSWNSCSKQHGFSFLILASKSQFPFIVNGIWRLTCCWGFWPCRAQGIATTAASKHAWVGCVCVPPVTQNPPLT